MKNYSYTFQREPRNKLYFDLIDFAKSRCRYAWLVIHPRIPLDSSCDLALHTLSMYLYQICTVSEWPGTKLLRSTASLYKYRFSDECAQELKSLTKRLYGWMHPKLPEDLCLMVDEELPLLVSIAHENDSYLCLTEDDFVKLNASMPDLAQIIKLDT